MQMRGRTFLLHFDAHYKFILFGITCTHVINVHIRPGTCFRKSKRSIWISCWL